MRCICAARKIRAPTRIQLVRQADPELIIRMPMAHESPERIAANGCHDIGVVTGAGAYGRRVLLRPIAVLPGHRDGECLQHIAQNSTASFQRLYCSVRISGNSDYQQPVCDPGGKIKQARRVGTIRHRGAEHRNTEVSAFE